MLFVDVSSEPVDKRGYGVTSVKLMTSNLLAEGVPMLFEQPFIGVGYGMNLGIVLDPAQASFNGGGVGAGTYYWGGVHGTWFWVDPFNDIIVVGMVQQESAGNAMTGRPIPWLIFAEFHDPLPMVQWLIQRVRANVIH